VEECEELIDRIDTEIQRRQPALYPGHNDEDILRPDDGELILDIPRRRKNS
jgi:hypothetical protein